jgi:hypothetical protein
VRARGWGAGGNGTELKKESLLWERGRASRGSVFGCVVSFGGQYDR